MSLHTIVYLCIMYTTSTSISFSFFADSGVGKPVFFNERPDFAINLTKNQKEQYGMQFVDDQKFETPGIKGVFLHSKFLFTSSYLITPVYKNSRNRFKTDKMMVLLRVNRGIVVH